MTQAISSAMVKPDHPLSQQCTLGATVSQAGVGLHSGAETQVRVLPAAANTGRIFVRTDLPGSPTVPARVEAVKQTLLSTE